RWVKSIEFGCMMQRTKGRTGPVVGHRLAGSSARGRAGLLGCRNAAAGQDPMTGQAQEVRLSQQSPTMPAPVRDEQGPDGP
ncbi:MAG: hypothetical protein O3C45_04775, partial [Bacteroidetes bacterium]|nr:hypothetical protein [Bacteroidota bacterium]